MMKHLPLLGYDKIDPAPLGPLSYPQPNAPLDGTWLDLTQFDATWLDLTRLIPPYWLPSLGKYLWWQKNGLAHEGKRERGHLLCSFLMSWDYFVVSVYPRTVCKCQEGTQGCPIYEPAASHHTHPQRTQWAEKIREIATLVCNFMKCLGWSMQLLLIILLKNLWKSAILLKHTFCQSKINVVLWYFPHFFAQYATHWKTRRGGSRLVRNRAKWSRTCPWSSTLQIHEFFLNGSLLAMNDRNYEVYTI